MAEQDRSHARPIGWGIVGTGAIAERFAADLAAVNGARRVAVLSRTLATAETFASRQGFAVAQADPDVFYALPQLDIVYIATPYATHERFALAAINAGRAVLVEKPLADTPLAARRIAEAAEQRGIFAMEALWSRFLPAVAQAKRLIDAGAIGRIRQIDAELAFAQTLDPQTGQWNGRDADPTLDLGVYPVSLALYFLGLPQRWRVERTRIAGAGAVSSATVQLQWAGAQASLSCGYDREGANAMILRGEAGALRLDRHFLQAPAVTLFKGRGPALASNRVGRLADRLPLPGRKRIAAPPRGHGFTHEIEAAMAAMREGATQSPIMPLHHSVATLEIMAADR